MSRAIQKAIIARFDGDVGAGTVYAAVGGRLYYAEAPEEETRPYIVFTVIDLVTDMTFASNLIRARVQFDIWDEDPEPNDVNDIAVKLKTRFHRTALTYADADYTAVGCVLESQVGPMREGAYWRVSADYMVHAQET